MQMPNMLQTAMWSNSDSEQHRITAQNRFGVDFEEKKKPNHNVFIEKLVDTRMMVIHVRVDM